MKKILLVLVVLAALFAVWKLWIAGPSIPADSKATLNEEQQAPTTVYTTADLEKHAKAADCWFALGGTVYDATAYVATDAGTSLASACGTDATAVFAGLPIKEQDDAKTFLDESYRKGDLAL